MHESFPGPETNKPERQKVIDAYKKIIEEGITDPLDMNLEDPEVIKANNLYNEYFKQQHQLARGDKAAETKVNFEQTMFYLEAGFTDSSYAEEVLLDHAQQDIENAENESPELVSEMNEKIGIYIAKLLPGIDPKHPLGKEA